MVSASPSGEFDDDEPDWDPSWDDLDEDGAASQHIDPSMLSDEAPLFVNLQVESDQHRTFPQFCVPHRIPVELSGSSNPAQPT